MTYVKGQTGNAGGRPAITKAIRAAGYDPDELRVEVIQALVTGMRTLNPGSPKEAKSWQFCVDRLDVRLHGPVREVVQVDEAPLTDAEYQAEIAEIVRERLAELSADERLKLLADPAPAPTIQ